MVREKVRRQWQKIKDLFLHHVLHVEDTPHRIALRAAIGIFVAWTPTFGLQTILTVALSAIFRANKVAGVPMVWLTNPVSNPAIYGFSYFVGHFLRTGSWNIDPKTAEELKTLIRETMKLDIWDASFWSRLLDVSLRIGLELWVGSCVVGLALALITYPLVKKAVIRYRKHRSHKKLAVETPKA